MPATNTGDWISAALDLVQIAAIVIGAVWAYYKFFRGRIFHKRAEPTVEASLLSANSSYAVQVKVTLENTGSADIPLRVTLLTVASYVAGDVDEYGRPRWPEVARAHAFKDHDSVESQETIIDDLLIPLRKEDAPERRNILAYRVSCQVYERRSEGGGIVWTTKTIVPAPLETPKGGTMSPQRRADEEEIRDAESEEIKPAKAQHLATEAEIARAEQEGVEGDQSPAKGQVEIWEAEKDRKANRKVQQEPPPL
jgi:hypothetical protein